MSELKHYGTPRHSGRYPWGSGETPQRSKSFRQEIKELKAINKEMLDVLKACEELQGDVLMEVSTSQRIFNAMVEYNEKLNKVIRKARGKTE